MRKSYAALAKKIYPQEKLIKQEGEKERCMIANAFQNYVESL
jgi:hypothetical protein